MASTNRVSVYSKLRRKETDALSSQQQLTEDGTYCAFANFKRHMETINKKRAATCE
jgi:hypothetical protein